MFVRESSGLYRILRRRAALAASLALAVTLALTAFLTWTLDLSMFATPRALVVGAILFVTTAPHLGSHPHRVVGLANHLTLARAVMVAVLAALVFDAEASWRPGLVVTASVAFGLDGVDGWLARRLGTASEFGARLDMELDALFVLVLCGLAATVSGAGPWVWAAGLSRYLFVGAAAVWPFMARPLPPTRRRPWACGLGIGLLIGSLAPLPEWITALAAAAGVVAIVGSFAIDVGWLVRHREAPAW